VKTRDEVKDDEDVDGRAADGGGDDGGDGALWAELEGVPQDGHKLSAERAEAVKHGLRECLRCWKQCGTDSECEGVTAAKGNGAWAKKTAAAAAKGGK
jgi:hypothetical protein